MHLQCGEIYKPKSKYPFVVCLYACVFKLLLQSNSGTQVIKLLTYTGTPLLIGYLGTHCEALVMIGLMNLLFWMIPSSSS